MAAVIGKWVRAFDLYDWLALSGPKFWSGQIWRLASYALLPVEILDFVMNSVALVMLGGVAFAPFQDKPSGVDNWNWLFVSITVSTVIALFVGICLTFWKLKYPSRET